MIRKNTILASAAAALLLSGTAFAAGVQPAAGEAPFGQTQATAVASHLQRADVRAAALDQAPEAGNLPLASQGPAASTVTRAQVREATRDAMAHGYRAASGNLS